MRMWREGASAWCWVYWCSSGFWDFFLRFCILLLFREIPWSIYDDIFNIYAILFLEYCCYFEWWRSFRTKCFLRPGWSVNHDYPPTPQEICNVRWWARMGRSKHCRSKNDIRLFLPHLRFGLESKRLCYGPKYRSVPGACLFRQPEQCEEHQRNEWIDPFVPLHIEHSMELSDNPGAFPPSPSCTFFQLMYG